MSLRIMTIFGTRPEIIRLSRVVDTLDAHSPQTLVHTGQNYDPNLSDIFFQELKVRPPDIHMGIVKVNFAAQVGEILEKTGAVLQQVRPDRVLILGDTNSGLAALVAARHGIPVFHMEAGNRCYDDRVPEEINRRLIDHSSTILMPYTHRSKENLLREGIERDRIFVTGNPIGEVLKYHRADIARSEVRDRMGVEDGQYVLATMHRAENVDDSARLRSLLLGMSCVAGDLGIPVILCLHPHTADQITRGKIEVEESIRVTPPIGFFDFVCLEKHARLVISDSGTVQEECAIFGVPSVTIRDVTERAETIEVGSNMLSGAEPESIQRAAKVVLGCSRDWVPPKEYLTDHVSRTVAKIMLGHLGPVGRFRSY